LEGREHTSPDTSGRWNEKPFPFETLEKEFMTQCLDSCFLEQIFSSLACPQEH